MKLPGSSGDGIDLQSRLEDAILKCDNLNTLIELLDRQAATAAPSAKLDAHLRNLLKEPVPHVAAAIFRLYRYTDSGGAALQEDAASYLTLSCYDGDWYDETINSIGWANDLLADGKPSPLVTAYQQFLDDAEEQAHDELLEFCRGYGR